MWPVHHSPALSSRDAGRALDQLQEDGELARWQMLASLEDFAHQQVRTVATSIFREVADLDESERSEERRVGKECRGRWWREHEEAYNDVCLEDESQ